MKFGSVLTGILVWLAPVSASAQIDSFPGRRIVFGEIGHSRTFDDEGLLGQGASLSAGIGYRVLNRLTLQGIVQRMPYYRDVEWLTFDGRVLFTGIEAVFQSTRRTTRPFVTIGVGMFDDDGVWIRKTIVQPSLPRIEERIDRSYRLSAMTISGGFDRRISERLAIRAGLRFHGLLDTGDDLAPHVIIQPSAGIVWRW